MGKNNSGNTIVRIIKSIEYFKEQDRIVEKREKEQKEKEQKEKKKQKGTK